MTGARTWVLHIHSHMVLSKENSLLQNSLSTPPFNSRDFQLLHIDIALLVSIHMNRYLNQKTNYTYHKWKYIVLDLQISQELTDHHKSQGYKLEFIIDK